jgi:hypothetical protein
MTVENRRALIARLIERETAAGRAIDRDSDFVALVELWILGEIEMPEMRRRYQIVREIRLEKKRLSLAIAQEPPSPNNLPEESDLISEIGRLSGHDVTN